MKRTGNELYEAMREAIWYMRENAQKPLAPKDVAARIGMSESRFAHAFKEWAGISPKRYLSHLKSERALAHLKHADVLAASLRTGLSSPGRLHTLLVEHEAISPGEGRTGKLEIRFGIHPSPFGPMLIGKTARGIAKLSFLARGTEHEALKELRSAWQNASLVRDQRATSSLSKRIFSGKSASPLVVRGTNFQIQVWKALLAIPEGRTSTYAAIAKAIGAPRAVRAVGTAIGKNPIGYLIPCHRVLTSGGSLGGYRWDPKRKEALLMWESARETRAKGRGRSQGSARR